MDIKLFYNFERKEYAVYFDDVFVNVTDDLAEALQTFLAHVTDVEV